MRLVPLASARLQESRARRILTRAVRPPFDIHQRVGDRPCGRGFLVSEGARMTTVVQRDQGGRFDFGGFGVCWKINGPDTGNMEKFMKRIGG